MRRDSNRIAAYADEHTRRGETLRQSGREPTAKLETEHVTDALTFGRDGATECFGLTRDRRGERGEVVVYVRNRPIEHLRQRGGRHGREHELRELAHVEPPCARAIVVHVVHEPREVFGARTHHPRLFDRRPRFLPARRYI